MEDQSKAIVEGKPLEYPEIEQDTVEVEFPEITDFVRNMKLKSGIFGFQKEDVYEKMQQLNKMYQSRAQQMRDQNRGQLKQMRKQQQEELEDMKARLAAERAEEQQKLAEEQQAMKEKFDAEQKEAYELLKLAQNLNFVGNAEGRDIFTGDIDVVVCDGFVGNVVVKMSEGLASALVRMLKRLFTSGFLPALGGMLAKGAVKKFATTIDYAEYGGAPLLGLQGLAIVCHGRSSARAMQNAIKMAGTFVRKGTNDRLAETILANEELTRFSRAI